MYGLIKIIKPVDDGKWANVVCIFFFGFLMKTNLWALWDTIFIIEQCVWVFSVFFSVGEKWGGVKWEKVKERVFYWGWERLFLQLHMHF